MKRWICGIFLICISLMIVTVSAFCEETVVLSVNKAMRAAVVSMTNAQAIDVFSTDGNTYDPSKFHSYDDLYGSHMIVFSRGTWSVKEDSIVFSEDTWSVKEDAIWHVDDLILKIAGTGTFLKVSMDVAFDGENYVISNVVRIMASYEYLNSDDSSRINIEQWDSAANAPYLVVSPQLVENDRIESSDANLKEYQAKSAFEYYGNALYPSGFECHWFAGLRAHVQAVDGSWYFKVNVTVTEKTGETKEMVAEAYINNITERVEDFEVYSYR